MSNTRQTSQSAVPLSQEPYSKEMEDAWWQSHNAGLIRNAARNQPSPPSKLIPRPLAAYRLGLLSRSIWLRNKSLWETPNDQRTWFGVPQVISQLHEARLALRAGAAHDPPEIDHWVYAELPFVLSDFNRLTANLIQAAPTGQYNGARFGSGPVPGIELWQQLRSLADEAFDEGSPPRPYYELGVALGEYQLKLWDLDQAAVMSNDLGLFPDIIPVVERARQLPEDDVRRIPLLWSMVQSAPELNSGEQATFCRLLIDENSDAFSLPSSAVGFRTINELARTLDTRIQDGLQRIALEPTQTRSGQQREKPSWRVDLLELYAGDRLVRRVAKQAHSLIEILNRFEKEGWPTTIANPLKTSSDPERLKFAVKSLNKGLKQIRFRSTGNGRGITWDWNPILKYRDPWTR
jgi:hypothetical protein